MDAAAEQLIRRCQAGDARAWEELVRAHQGRVYALAYHSTRDRDEALDLAQEAFVRVYRRLPTLQDPGRFVPWLLAIVRHAAIDRSRRLRARPPARDLPAEEQADLADGAPRPDELAERASDRRLVDRALRRMASAHREIIVLKDMQGLALEEIAGMLDLPVGTVKSRSHRARIELARVIMDLQAEGSRA